MTLKLLMHKELKNQIYNSTFNGMSRFNYKQRWKTLLKSLFWVSLLIAFNNSLLFAASSNNSKTNCDKAYAIFSNGQWASPDKANTYYLQSIDMCPGFIRPYELIGNYYRKQGRTKDAITSFEVAAKLGSTNYKLYYQLSSLHYSQKNYSQSLKHIKKSLKINNNYQNAIKLKKKIIQASDIKAPVVKLYEPTRTTLNRVAHFYNVLTFRGQITDQNRIAEFTIGGEKIPIDDEGNFLSDVPLSKGLNNIPITCRDELGNSTQFKVQIHRAIEIGDTAIYRKSYAIVIGINDYEKIPKLGSAVSDAKAIVSILEKAKFDEITLLLNEQATQRRILTELYSKLPQKVERDDRIIFYFAGHGMTFNDSNKPEQGFIIPVESTATNYPETAISMEQIRNLCSHIKAKHIMFIMDCCYSGHIIRDGQKTNISKKPMNKNIMSKRVIQIFTAGDKDQQAMETENHGLFTLYFLKALAGKADINQDRVITGSEIGEYIPKIVDRISKNKQTPVFSHIEGKGDVLFFYNQ